MGIIDCGSTAWFLKKTVTSSICRMDIQKILTHNPTSSILKAFATGLAIFFWFKNTVISAVLLFLLSVLWRL